MSRIDFRKVNDAAIRSLPLILLRWLPDGKHIAGEYVARNPTRNDAQPGSFKIKLNGSKAGVWSDFATGDRGGDPVSLAAYLHNLSQADAARQLAQMLGVDPELKA